MNCQEPLGAAEHRLEGTRLARAGALWQTQLTRSRKGLEHSEGEEGARMLIADPQVPLSPVPGLGRHLFASGTW